MSNERPVTLKTPVEISPFAPARQIRTKTHIIYLDPRIAAPKLAEYAVADACRRETIARNAKMAKIAVVAIPSRVRTKFPESFSENGLNAEMLRAFSQIPAVAGDNDWHKREKSGSSLAFLKLAEIAPMVDCKNSRIIHPPEGGWPNLMIGGTHVSIQPEIVFSTINRRVQKVGAIILNTAQGDGYSLDRDDGKFSVGQHLAALLIQFLGERLTAYGPPLPAKCYALDIHRKRIHNVPSSYKTLLNRMEASCRNLAAIWASLPGMESGDEPNQDEEDF